MQLQNLAALAAAASAAQNTPSGTTALTSSSSPLSVLTSSGKSLLRAATMWLTLAVVSGPDLSIPLSCSWWFFNRQVVLLVDSLVKHLPMFRVDIFATSKSFFTCCAPSFKWLD